MIKKIAISVALTVLTVPSVYAYGTQDKPYCPNLSQYGNSKYFLSRGMRDKDTQAKRDVSELQNFLANKYGLLPSDVVTGYFGQTTKIYVKMYQKENGLPQSGMVGQATRAKLAAEAVCVSNQATNKPAVYVLGITEKNYIVGTYANIPKNSQVSIVNNTTGKKYEVQNALIVHIGQQKSGTLEILIPADFASNGRHYIQADYQDDGKTVTVKSSPFMILGY